MFSLNNSTASLLLLFGVFSLTRSINYQITYDYSMCLDQSNETSYTSYNSNLTVLLDSLSSKAYQNYSFYNENSNVGIYALFLCRGDVSHGSCQTCVSYAIGNITTRPSNKTAIIWYDQCLLRYSDVNFFGQAQILPMVLMWNIYENTSSTDLPNFYTLGLMYYLINRTKVTDMLYTSDNQTVTLSDGSKTSYGLVQCTRDVDDSSCSQCLSDLMKIANSCCQAKIGWRILSPSCYLSYENYSFTEQSTAIQTVNGNWQDM